MSELSEDVHETLYHVTFTARVANIKKIGIVPGKARNWEMALDGSKYGERGYIYLFTTEESAARWAHKMAWEFKRPVSIIVLRDVEANLIDDESGEAYLMTNGAGTWKRTQGTVPPQCIERIISWEPEMAKKLVAITSGRHDGSPIFEGAEDPSAIVHRLRNQWVEQQGKTPQQINTGQCFDFAEELESEHPELFEAEGFGNFCNHDWNAGQCSDDATHFEYEKWMEPRGWHPPHGLTWDDMFELFRFDGTHGWAYCGRNGLCYDIEAPDGVKNVFDLPFLQRIIHGYLSEKA
jgi:hypothetical protein